MTATTEPAANVPGTNSGHGHVWKRPDGRRYRCGGLHMCQQCRNDLRTLADHPIQGVHARRVDAPHRPIVVAVTHDGPAGPVTVSAALTVAEAALVAAQILGACDTTNYRTPGRWRP
jgi:hypothetical protein